MWFFEVDNFSDAQIANEINDKRFNSTRIS